MEIQMWWVWVILAVLFAIAEIFTAGFFLLWFGIGAAVAAILAYLNVGAGWQWMAFILVSLALFAGSRRFAERFTHRQPSGVGADRYVGKHGMVLETIDSVRGTGRVRLDSEEWRAESESGDPVPAGTEVAVVRLDGTRLVVSVVKERV